MMLSTTLRRNKPKASPVRFMLRALPLLTMVLAVEFYIGQRFLVGGDDQVDRCLPDKRVYLIDTSNKDIWAG